MNKESALDVRHVPPARTLYHYTDLVGFQGIVSTNSIWATHARYLNDVQEIRYAQGLLKRAVGLKNTDAQEPEKEILRQLEQYIDDGWLSNHSVFVASFSEQGNLLSQWRAYSQSGGVSLGFAPEKIN